MELASERRLFLACARANASAEDCARIAQALTQSDLDWNYLKSAACRHGVAPLVYQNLQRSGANQLIPQQAMEALRNSYYGNAARNSLLFDELSAVLNALRRKGIEVIVLKGAALAETVYPNRAVRPMNDIDLLVRREKLAEVESKLLDMGYIVLDRAKGREFYRKHHYHLAFSRNPDVAIEVHWHIQTPNGAFEIDIDDLWRNAQASKIAGVEAFLLCPETLLLYLCQHSWKHRLKGGIRPFVDIAATTKVYASTINWKDVVRLSIQWQMNSCAYLGLSLAGDLCGGAIPESFLREIKPVNFEPAILDLARERVLGYGEGSPVSANLLRLVWKGHGFADRLRAFHDALHCSPSKSSYQDRIAYLLKRYGPVIWRLLWGDQETRVAAGREAKQQRLTQWMSEASMSLDQRRLS